MGAGRPKRRREAGGNQDTPIEANNGTEPNMGEEVTDADGWCAEPIAAVELSSAAKEVSREERNRLVSDLMRLMIFHHTEGPVKRSDVLKLVMKDYARVSGLTKYVVDQARLRLFHTFGYTLVEFTKERSANVGVGNAAGARRHASATADAAGAAVKLFALENALSVDNLKGVVFSGRHGAEIALRMVACSIVACGGDKLEEETLWVHLQSLGMHRYAKDHLEFGDVEKKVEALVKQRYLIKEKAAAGGVVYKLGERAKDEIGLQEILSFSRAMAGPDPEASADIATLRQNAPIDAA